MKKTVAIILLMIILLSMITNVVNAETGTINTTTVRMRREANTSSDVLQLVGLGTEVEVLGEENGWYRVEYNGLTGYISSEYIDVEGEVSSSNEETPNTIETNDTDTSDTTGSGEIVENTTDTNEPETSNNDSNNSENTETPNTTDTNAGDETISETSESTEFVLTNDANLRTIPSFTSNRISTIPQGTTVSVLDTLNRWVKITDGTNSGWVVRQNVEEVTSTGDTTTTADDSEVTVAMVDNGETSSQSSSTTAFPSNGTVNTDGSRLRDSADGKVYTLLDLNTALEIVGEENDWYIVNVGEYTDAYISKSLVTIN